MATGTAGYLVLTNISHRQWSYQIDERRQVVGRADDADIQVPRDFDLVSRWHAEVWADRCGIWIRDLGSTHGTCVNGVWVDHVPRAGIVAGDTIQMGDAQVEVVSRVEVLAHARSCGNSWDDTPIVSAPQPPGRDLMTRLLSPAEIDILLWMSRGYENDTELGRLLHRSPKTVETEINNIFRKLNVHTRAQLMGWIKRANAPDGGLLSAERRDQKR